MILYEGHSTIHGRPFELKGSFYANAFVSFEPTGRGINDDGSYYGEETPKDGLPPFVLPDSPEEPIWRKEHPDGWSYHNPLGEHTLSPHYVAAVGNIAELQNIALEDPKLLHEPDENGWRLIHEAARGGHEKAVAFLLEQGADVNAVTAAGETPLDLIYGLSSLMKKHPIVTFLKQRGAVTQEQL